MTARSVLQNKSAMRAQKVLFSELKTRYGEISSIGRESGIVYQGIWDMYNCKKPVSIYSLGKLCSMVDGKVMPHEVRPDLFTKELCKLYGINLKETADAKAQANLF